MIVVVGVEGSSLSEHTCLGMQYFGAINSLWGDPHSQTRPVSFCLTSVIRGQGGGGWKGYRYPPPEG